MNKHSRRSRDNPVRDRHTHRFARRHGSVWACAPARVAAALAPQAASAQGRLEAQYEATLAGIPVGKGSLDHRNRRRHVFGLRPGRHRRAVEGVFRRHRFRRQPGPRRQRRAGGQCLYRHHQHAKKSETIRMVLANGRVKDFSIDPAPPVDPDRVARHRRAPERRARSHDRLDAARARQWRTAVAGVLPQRHRHFRRPHALRSQARLQAHGNREGRARLSRPGAWSARSISRRSRATSRIAR